MLRAAQKVVAADPDWIACRIEGQGRGWVFLNLANVQSYTLGRIIIDTSNVYCSEKRAQRQPGQWVGAGPGFRRKIVDDHRDIVPDRAELLASCCYGPPNELYAKQVAYHIGWRDGDAATRAAVDASREADHQAWLAEGKRLAARIRGGRPLDDVSDYDRDGTGNETLTALADHVRALMVQNDPDALRAGLAEIAAALDTLRVRDDANTEQRRDVAPLSAHSICTTTCKLWWRSGRVWTRGERAICLERRQARRTLDGPAPTRAHFPISLAG